MTLGIVFLLAIVLYISFFLWYSSPTSVGANIISKNLSNQYYIKDNKVVFVSGANFFSLGAREIENADLVSCHTSNDAPNFVLFRFYSS